MENQKVKEVMKNTIIFYQDQYQQVARLPAEMRLRVYDAFFAYCFNDRPNDFPFASPEDIMLNALIANQKRDSAKYEKMTERRKQAIEYRKKVTETKNLARTHTSNNDNDNENGNVDVDVNGNGNVDGNVDGNDNGVTTTNVVKTDNNKLCVSNNNESADAQEDSTHTIFKVSLSYLAAGYPDAWKEATQKYELNESFGWKGTRGQTIRNRAAWMMRSRPSKEACFAPRDGAVLAEVLSHFKNPPRDPAVINNFRGLLIESAPPHGSSGVPAGTVTFVFTSQRAAETLRRTYEQNEAYRGYITAALQRAGLPTENVQFIKKEKNYV